MTALEQQLTDAVVAVQQSATDVQKTAQDEETRLDKIITDLTTNPSAAVVADSITKLSSVKDSFTAIKTSLAGFHADTPVLTGAAGGDPGQPAPSLTTGNDASAAGTTGS